MRGINGTRSSIGIIFWVLVRGEEVVEEVVLVRFGLEKVVESFIFAVEVVEVD